MQTQCLHFDFKYFTRKNKLWRYLKLAKLGNTCLIWNLGLNFNPRDIFSSPPCIMKREVIKLLDIERIGFLFKHIIYFLLKCFMGRQTNITSYVWLCICAVCEKQTPQIFWDHSVRAWNNENVLSRGKYQLLTSSSQWYVFNWSIIKENMWAFIFYRILNAM
jgi:hypothetical protein